MTTPKTKFYAIAKGHNPGIYDNLSLASENIKGFSGAVYERFNDLSTASAWLDTYQMKHPTVIDPSSKLDTLTDEQMNVISHLLQGENIALLGTAGCGKSYLLSVIYTEYPTLKKKMDSEKFLGTGVKGGTSKMPLIRMCAMTGCAALLLGHGAKTLHSWAGIGLGKGSVQELIGKIRRNKKAMRNWLTTNILIIDEISMMNAELLDKLNEIGKCLRSNRKPFGGLQLLFVGDFFQLPPVNKTGEPTIFAFESDAWKESINRSIELTQIQRQKDSVFQRILKEAQIGALSPESCKILQDRMHLDWRQNKIRPTLLYPRKAEVDMVNDSNLRELTGERHIYKARLIYDGKVPDGWDENNEYFQRALSSFDSNAPYKTQIELVVGAQVMLVANIDSDNGMVNGSRGVIVEFSSTNLPIVEFVNGMRKIIVHHSWEIEDYEFVSRSQVPLRLAYASTIHTSQGASFDSALVDIGTGNFEFGQAYVALSRARNLEALYVYDFNPIAFKAHPKVKAFYEKLHKTAAKYGECALSTFTKLEILELNQRVIEERVLAATTATTVTATDKSNKVVSDLTLSSVCCGDVTITKLDTPVTAVATAIATEAMTDAIAVSQVNWLFDAIPSDWKGSLTPCKNKLAELSTLLSSKQFLPSKEHIWRALELTPLKAVNVVILGQDPYPTKGNAHGLAFSVLPDVRPLPASLKNIYKELGTDVGFVAPLHGHLEDWAKQGVLLLNTVLTVEEGCPQSHTKIGWEEVTDQIIRSVAEQLEGVVFVLWGKSAQVKKKLLGAYLDKNRHKIIESVHPSPLSASKGFFGSRPFSKVNQLLGELGKKKVVWQLA